MDDLLKLCPMWRKESKAGRVYWIGVAGGLKLLLLEDQYATGPDAAGWNLFVTARGERRQQKADEPKPPPRCRRDANVVPLLHHRSKVDGDLNDDIPDLA